MTYYGYARVSTKDQSDYSIENQLEYLREKADGMGMVFEPHSEKRSGKNLEDRTELQLVISRAGRGDVVGFYDNNRLGRSTEENLSIVRELTDKGVQVQVGGRIVDVNDPHKKFMLTIDSAVSTLYREEQNKKSRAGIKVKKKKGDWIFTSRLYGYRVFYVGGRPSVEIVEEEAAIIRHFFEEYAKGRSINSICNELNEAGHRTRSGTQFNPASVRRWILTPVYMGYYKPEGGGSRRSQSKVPLRQANLVKSKNYEPIVSEDLWWRAYESYRTVKRTHARQFEYRFSYYELGGLLKCYHCKEVSGKATGYVHSYQKSENRVNEQYVNRVHVHNCQQRFHTFQARILEKLFEALYCLCYIDLTRATKLVEARRHDVEERNEPLESELRNIGIQKARLETEINRLLESIASGTPAALVNPKIREKQNQIEQVQRRAVDLEQDVEADEEEIRQLHELASEQKLESFIHADPPKRRKAHIELIQSAYVYRGQIVVRTRTGLSFVTTLSRNRGRHVQSVFDVRVWSVFPPPSRFLFEVRIDTEADSWTLIQTAADPDRVGSLWEEAAYQHRADQLQQLKQWVNESKTT